MKNSGIPNLRENIEVVTVLFYNSSLWNVVIHQIFQDEYMVHFDCVKKQKYIQKRKKIKPPF